MKVYFTRDSVSAADDLHAPHAHNLKLPDDVRDVVNAAVLPRIDGGQATWCISSGLPLAVIAQQWDEPRLLSFIPYKISELDMSGPKVKLHFTYFAQQDPEIVYEILHRLRLRVIEG
jgi:hypothetical protein